MSTIDFISYIFYRIGLHNGTNRINEGYKKGKVF